MTDSRDTVHGSSPKSGLLFESWRAIDPIYIWSALIGLVVALLLIGVGIAMQTRALG